MFNPEMIQGFIDNTLDNYVNLIVLFILVIFISVNLKEMIHSLIIGWFIKAFKQYKPRDIIRIDGELWYLDHLNSYRVKFLKVIDIDDCNIVLSKEELSIEYSQFLKSKIRRVSCFN